MTLVARASAFIVALTLVHLAAPNVTPDRRYRYVLHLPESQSPSTLLPLVMVFHGERETPADTERSTGFSELAEREGFAVVYPAAPRGSWTAVTPQFDPGMDLWTVGRIIDELVPIHRIDRKRIYATGSASGAIFTHRLGCEMADTFAAIAPVGAVDSVLVASCQPREPIPMLSVQGDAPVAAETIWAFFRQHAKR